MIRGFILAAVVTVLPVACSGATGPVVPPPAAVVGCYGLTMGRWSGSHESPDLPAEIILLDSLGSYLLENGRPLVRPYPLGAPMPFNMAWWSRPAGDTLELMFSQDGVVGVRLQLAWAGARWAGRGEAFTDVLPGVQATANGSLTPKPCP